MQGQKFHINDEVLEKMAPGYFTISAIETEPIAPTEPKPASFSLNRSKTHLLP